MSENHLAVEAVSVFEPCVLHHRISDLVGGVTCEVAPAARTRHSYRTACILSRRAGDHRVMTVITPDNVVTSTFSSA